MKITIKRLEDAIKHPYAEPGLYDLVALTSDGGLLCMECCKSNLAVIKDSMRGQINDGWWVVGLGYEAVDAESAKEVDEDLVSNCDHCGREFGEIAGL